MIGCSTLLFYSKRPIQASLITFQRKQRQGMLSNEAEARKVKLPWHLRCHTTVPALPAQALAATTLPRRLPMVVWCPHAVTTVGTALMAADRSGSPARSAACGTRSGPSAPVCTILLEGIFIFNAISYWPYCTSSSRKSAGPRL